MYVEKFAADSLDQALKKIKSKLGPDAVILKTVTNKGLMGALKKNKIEITAAISEASYHKKAQVDQALGGKFKQQFYQAPSSHVSQMIKRYGQNSPQQSAQLDPGPAVGDLVPDRGLDNFLSGEGASHVARDSETFELGEQQRKIDLLEKRVFELAKKLEQIQQVEPVGIFQVRGSLKGLGLKEALIAKIFKQATFELGERELASEEDVLEAVLAAMAGMIHIEQPLFSKLDQGARVVTVLLSGNSVGQTTACYKLSSLKENSTLIRLAEETDNYRLAKKVFGISERMVHSIAEIATECRRVVDSGQNVFVDYGSAETHHEDIKQFLKGLKRSFEHVEVLACLSSIHSETYNRKCLNHYGDILDGIIWSKLDLCLDFGSLINVHTDFSHIPLKFFTTGKTIPDDIEAATKERLLNGMFHLDRK